MDLDQMLAEVERDIKFATSKAYFRNHMAIGRDDFEQELRLKVFMAAARWDGSKSKWRSFVRHRIRWMASDVVRHCAGFKTRKGNQWRAQFSDSSFDLAPTRLKESPHHEFDDVDWGEFLEFISRQPRDVRIVVDWALGLYTMAELGERYGITLSRISQIISKKNEGVWMRIRAIGESLRGAKC